MRHTTHYIKKDVVFVLSLLVVSTTIVPTSAYEIIWNLSPQTTASNTTFYVGGAGPGNYTTIQAAIDNSSEGDTVFVYSGLYPENIQINKSIRLQGENSNSTIIDGGTRGNVITLGASTVVVQSFTIQNAQNDIQHAGIAISNGNNIQITGNILRENEGVGIIVQGVGTKNIDINDNIISNNTYGVYVTESSEVTISSNIIDNNEMGLYYVGVSNCQIIGNTMKNKGLGLHIEQSSHVLVAENTVFENRNGIYLFNSSECILSANTIQENRWYGIWLKDSSENTIERNDIFGNVDLGLYLDTSFDNMISNNTLIDNDNGIYFKDSVGNIISNNLLRNDKFNACFVTHTLVHRRNIWQSNYWERPRLLPYPIFGTIKLQNRSFPGISFDWTPLRQPMEPLRMQYHDNDDTIFYVGGSGPNNYSFIQNAIDDAGHNDTVYVFHGTYREVITITKSIHLVGEDKTTTILDGDGTNDIITIASNNVTISGFTIQNGHFNILLNHSSYGVISGNNINNALHAVSAQNGCRFLIITNNSFYDNVYGIRLYYSSEITVSYNNFLSYKMNAFFFGDSLSQGRHHWYNNYWGAPRYLPYPVFGKIRFGTFSLVRINYDFHPLSSPSP